MLAVVFDWDGTLADTAQASYRCYARTFAELSIPFDEDTYARTYSPDWHQTYRALGLPEERWGDADSRWLAFFDAENVGLLDGARELVESLSATGLRLGIVTTGHRERVQKELLRHGIAELIEQCVFGSDVRRRKPDPEGLLLCLDRMNVPVGEAVFVGDSPEDILMARRAGVRSIGVCGGYPNREALLAAQPDAFSHSVKGLVDLLHVG